MNSQDASRHHRSSSLSFFPGALAAAALAPAVAGQGGATVYLDANRNGVQDPGERGAADLPVRIVGALGAVDQIVVTGADGEATFPALPPGRFLVDAVEEPDFWPSIQSLLGDPPPIPNFPVGRHRFGHTRSLLTAAALADGVDPLHHVSIGDSVGFGFNFCGSLLGQAGYVEPVNARLGEAAAAVTLSQLAVPGYLTDDILCPGCVGNLFAAVDQEPDLVTISIGGNDFLDVDGNAAQTALALARIRQNLQEILSAIQGQLPTAEIVLNTYYDNEEGQVPFHNTWGPVFNQMLRDVALGQTRPVAVAEMSAEYAHFDVGVGAILGELGLICLDVFGLDGIHPTNPGYTVHREKVWEAMGGTDTLGGGDPDLRLGLIEHLERRFPTTTEDLGLGALDPASALVLDGTGASLPAGAGELRLAGFDSTARGLLRFARVSVTYRTTAAPGDDTYRFEAALDGLFAAPGTTLQTWNRVVPVVGSAGNGDAVVLAYPDAPAYRTTGASLTSGAPVDGAASVAWSDLENLAVRYQGLPVGAPDAFGVEWDAAYVDLYGVPAGRVFWEGDPSPGGTVTVHVTGSGDGDAALLLAALAPAPVPIPLPPFGELLLDPATLFVLASGPVSADGSLALSATVPAASGLAVALQGVVITNPVGPQAFLTPLETLEIP